MGELPEPDSQGLIRVTATISLNGDGTANLVELNDHPLPGDDEPDPDAPTADDAAPMMEPPPIPPEY